MRRFLVKITLFVALYSLLYLTLFYFADRGIKTSNYRDFAEWNEIYQGTINADVLIMGSSRAWRQVNPGIIDSNLNANSYNVGIDGFQIPMQLAKYEFYRKFNRKPNHIIYIVDHFSFWRRNNAFNKEQFIPYTTDPVIWNELKHYNGFSWPDHKLPYYSYIGSKEITFAGLFQITGIKSFEKDKYKGFRSSNKSWEPDFDIELAENPNGKRAPFNPSVYYQFENFLKKCQEENIEVTIVYSPEYITFQNYIKNRNEISDVYAHLANKYNFQYIDYKLNPMCFDKKYFYNPTHLNSSGSEIFTRDLVQKIQKQTE